MENKDLSMFLDKLTYKELKLLLKKVSGNNPKSNNKSDLIQEIKRTCSAKDIFKILEIENNTIDESLLIARKGLKRQRYEIIIAFSSLVIGFLALPFISENLNKTDNLDSLGLSNPTDVQSKCIDCFENNSNYHILIIPFGSSQNCDELNVICEREVMSRLNIIADSSQIQDLDVAVLQDSEINGRFVSQETAKEIGKKKGAHIVIWGSYMNKCNWDSTKIRLNWLSLTTEKLFYDKRINQEYTSIDEISQIEKGVLTGDVEELVYYLIGMKNYYKEDYKMALKYFYNIIHKNKPEYSKLSFLKGECYFAIFMRNREKSDSCFKYYNEAIMLDSLYFQSYERLGQLYKRIGKVKKAENIFKTGLFLTSRADIGMKFHFQQIFNQNIGVLYLKDSLNSLKSIEYFQKVIDINPQRLEIYHLITYVYIANEKYDLAVNHSCKILDKFPNDRISLKLIDSPFKTIEDKYPKELLNLLEEKANVFVEFKTKRDTIYVARDTIYKKVYKTMLPNGKIRYDTIHSFIK